MMLDVCPRFCRLALAACFAAGFNVASAQTDRSPFEPHNSTPRALRSGGTAVGFAQDRITIGLITADDDWATVPAIVGYPGDIAAGSTTGVNPMTRTADLLGAVDVVANQTTANITNGGVAKFHGANPVVATQGSARGDACAALVFPYTLPDNLPATLSQAIECANANGTADLIDLNDQTVTLTASLADYSGATGLPQVTTDVTLSNGTITRSGSNEFRLLSASNAATLRLTDLTLSNGGGSSYAAQGGGLSSQGSLFLTRVTMSGHRSTVAGGAIAIPSLQSGATVSILDSTLSGNTAQGGGAISFTPGVSGAVSLAGSTLATNVGTGGPGAIFISGSGATITVRNSTFSANSSSNTASPDAIGVFSAAQASIAFTTFSGHDNGSNASTVGILHATGGASVNLQASVIANNPRTGGGTARECTASSATFSGNTNYSADSFCPGRVAAPTFVDLALANNGGPTRTHLPAPHSNVVNADSTHLCGPANLNLAVDQRGQLRPRGPACDAGAVEIDACGAITFPYTLPDNTPATLNAAIDCANSTAAIADVIDLNGLTVTLTQSANDAAGQTGVLSVRSPVTLRNGTITRSGSNQFRLLNVDGSGNLTLRDMVLSNGGGTAYADSGSLVSANTGSTLSIIRSTLSGGVGSTGSSGGAIFASGALNLVNSSISGNSAGRGGALSAQNGPVLIANSMISGNVATNTTSNGGGAMYLSSITVNDVRIVNSTLAGNYATGSNRTGGIAGDATAGVDLILQNSIVWGNDNAGTAAPQIVNAAASSTNTATNSLIAGGQFGALDSDPLFVTPLTASATPSTAGNFALQNSSPAVDAGANANATADAFDVNGNSNTSEDAPDRAGNPRRFDDTGIIDTGSGTAPIVDIGAFEKQSNSIAPADFNITTTANSIIVVDNTSNGSTLLASEPVPDTLRFDAAGRTFSVNGGPLITGNSGNLALTGISSITVNASGGARVEPAALFNVGAATYASASPITLAGGTLKATGSTAVINAPIVLTADSDVAGNMRLAGAISGDFTLRTFGIGSYRFASTASTFARLQITSGTIVLEGNNTLPPQIDIFNSANFNLNGFSQSIDFYASSGSTQNTGAAANLTIGVAGSASSFGTANYAGPISGPINLDIAAGANQIISGNSSYSGTTTVSGFLQVRGSSSLGAVGAGNGTTVAASGTLDLRNVAYASSEALVLDGGILDVSSGNSSFPGTLALNSSGSDIRVAASSTLSLDGVVSGSQGFSKVGAGILALTQANTFSGPVAVNAGGLRILGSTAVASAVTINNGVLDGTGTVGGPLSLGSGTLTPGVGNVTGILRTANVVLASGSSALFNIAGATPDSQYDQLDVNGTINLGGAALNLVGTFAPTTGQNLVLIDNDGSDPVTGTFAGRPEGSSVTFNGVPLAISYVGGDGNDVVLTAVETSVGIAVAPASVLENGASNLTYTVTRSPSLPGATTVNISTSGTATSGNDYSGAVATVVIPANSTTATIIIAPTPDSTFEPDETVILTVESGSGYTVGTPTSATGTITNDDVDSCDEISFPYTLAGADNTARVANLRQAIQCANLNGSADTIDLDGQTVILSDAFASYTGATGLPEVSSDMTVRNGTLTRSGPAEFRIWYVSSPGNLTLDTVVVTNGFGQAPGQVGGGGALYVEGVVNIIGGRFSGHYSELDGGAIHVAGGAINARFAVFSGNFTNVPGGGVGGAMANSGGLIQLSNVLIAGNRAVQGGGIYNNSNGVLTLNNTTIAGNATNDQGGGLRNENTVDNATLNNTLISGNESSVFPALDDVGGEVTSNFSQVGGNPLYVSPLDASDTAPSTGGNYRLGALSPVADAGSNALSVFAVDLDGNPRRYNDVGVPDTGAGTAPIVDIGAYERQTNSSFEADLSITKTDGQTTEIPGTSITYTIVASNAGPLAVATATVADTFPANITGVAWTCVGAGGGTCPGSGSGNLNATVNLPVGGSVSFTATGTISAAATGTLSNTATVSSAVSDPTPSNNSATDSTTLVSLPQLSVNDVSANEGNSGTTQFDFTVSLSSPALAGGVSFDLATAAGTATAGSDYQSRSLTSQTIAQGQSTYTFSVQVNGDFTQELAETFFVSASNVVGANVSDGQGQGTIQNDDTAGITVAPTAGLTTTEAGGTATFTVVLDTQPTANVSIGLSSSDTTEGTVVPASLIFTSANFNVAQTVTVTGVDDVIVDGTVTYTILTAAATSADVSYAGFNASDVSVSNSDNDTAGVVLVQSDGSTQVAEGGSGDSYTLVLSSQPTGDVVITITPDSQLTVLPTMLTFTSANWNIAQSLMVSAVDDAVPENAHSGSIAHSATGGGYDGVTIAGLTVAIVDNDSAPTFAAAAAITRQQGSPASLGTVGVVSDPQDAPGSLAVSPLSGGTASGIVVSGLANAGGAVSAQFAATCEATPGTVRFRVTDSGGLNTDADLQVNVSPNTPPSLSYPAQSVAFGGSLTIAPSIAPSDNGRVVSVVLQSMGSYAGTVAVAADGTVTLGNAAPVGTHTVVVRATDDCGAVTDAILQITVGQVVSFKLVTANITPSRFGQPVTFSAQLVGLDPSGTVEFFAGSTSLGTAPLAASPSGGANLKLASLTVSTLPVGTHQVRVVYAGDANNQPSTSPNLVHVVQGAGSRIQLAPSANPGTVGSQAIGVEVRAESPGGGIPAGNVSLETGPSSCNLTLDPQGRGSCSLNFSTAGYHTITASYVPAGGSHLPATVSTALVIVGSPSQTDLRVRIGNGLRTVDPAQPLAYLVVVENLGSEAAVGRLEVPLSTDFTSASYTCLSAAAASCGQMAGSGSIDTELSLASGGLVIYSFSVAAPVAPERAISQLARIAAKTPTTDPVTANNEAVDFDFMGLFADGLEEPDLAE